MNSLIKILSRSRLVKGDLDLHLVRASMVLIFLLFGYQKWWEYEAQTLIPFISNGPLTSWMYLVFGLHGATYFLGVSEWLTAALLIWGFRNPKAGILGAILSLVHAAFSLPGGSEQKEGRVTSAMAAGEWATQ
jgi:uncharacterized membrane protein YkgB